MPKQALPNAPASKRLSEITLLDFRGGWRYSLDPFEVQPNELADVKNIVLDHQGGIRRRTGIQASVTTMNAAADIDGLVWAPQQARMFFSAFWGGSYRWVVSANGIASYTTIASGSPASQIKKSTLSEMNGFVYICNPGASVETQRIDASNTITNMTPGAYNDDYSSPSGVRFPVCHGIAEHQGYMFAFATKASAAGAFEGNGARVRFSHPGDAGSWRTNDWFEIPDGGRPYAGISMGDHLVILTRSGMWALWGNSPETFQLTRISDYASYGLEFVGIRPLYEFVPGVGLFLWATQRGGLWLWDGRRLKFVGEKIIDAHRRGILGNATGINYPLAVCFNPQSRLLHISFRFNDDRLGVITYGTLTYDVDLEAWSRWDMDTPRIEAYMAHTGERMLFVWNGNSSSLGAGALPFVCYHTEEPSAPATDTFGSAGLAVRPITSWFKTGWLDGGTIDRKGWKRIFITFNSTIPFAGDSTFILSYYKDYSTTVSKTSTFVAGATHDIEKVAAPGTAKAVQLRIDGPPISNNWSIDRISMKFVRR